MNPTQETRLTRTNHIRTARILPLALTMGCGLGNVKLELNSVTRFGEILPLRQNFKSLAYFWRVYLTFAKTFNLFKHIK